jgi:hypothetical protein
MWGIGPYLSRYNSIGSARVSNERELILCNMIFHKEFFLKQGGFCRDLYPNEENEFIKRVDSNRHIYYIPEAVVDRPARASARAFALQLFSYGKGRFKNIYLKKNFGDYIFVAPAFFSLYFIASPFLIFAHQWALMLPMLIYFLLTSYAGILRLRDFGVLVFLAPLFFILGHFSYGLGVWRGFFEYAIFQKDTKLQPASFINVHQLK